jgi:DHA1 family tetracycline resistance protein-like MFS transporter
VWLVCLAWGALALVQAGAALAAGVFTERLGPRVFLIAGWLVTGLLFAALTVAQGPWLIASGLGWSVIAGVSDGAEKTWLAELAPKEERALAFGALGVVNAAAMVLGGGLVGYGLQAVGPAVFWLPSGGLLLAIALIVRRAGPGSR